MSDNPELDRLADHVGVSLRAHRTARSMSLGDLARACGLSRTILARIEGGTGNPSLETLWRISRALDIPLGALLAQDSAPRVRVARARDGRQLHADSGLQMWLLHAEGREHRSEMYDILLPKDTDQQTDAHLPGTEETLICISGHARIGPLGEETDVRAGDVIWFAADRPHRYLALKDTRLVGWMLYGAGSPSPRT
ncbi:HTH-type transcriptional regulator SutR [Baekduia alba]|uniref:helix-turn-helix domain-containing protein n=1 Tax=Baekduia alba TaxID=2997333 RepID=UPI0023415851|nr:XRE family transcriptional regulator [Baekduia alba]WCB91930.1 HTH-type transcriptional regulator SutR [Baekduia alba]